MSERVRNYSDNNRYQTNTKMGPDIGPRKTMIVVVIVVGCFAVLWPKVFHPMFFGTVDEYIKPSAIDKSNGLHTMYSEIDINTIKIMSELCSSVIPKESKKPSSAIELVQQCRAEVLRTCGIDISAVLQEKIRLGTSVKQIINEVRSLNGSLCLKDNFGLAPWTLGVPHKIISNYKTISVRQERPPHMRAEIMHPAFRERGSAIPRSQTPKPPPAPKIVEGRPGPIPGMRPPMGGAGHVVPPSQKGSSMGIIMPIYTIGIVVFFTYTLMKLLFKKQPDSVGGTLYPPVEPDRGFRRDVFESAQPAAPRLSREAASKIVVTAMSALLDEVDEEIEARRKASEVANQGEATTNGTIANGTVKNRKVETEAPVVEPEQPSVKILGMETTASCESGHKWHPTTKPVSPPPLEIKEPPQEIFLEGALPAQSQILVSDSKTESEEITSDNEEDHGIVLAGKMTLSVISLDPPTEVLKQEEEMEDDIITDSKYTTASNATAAEHDVSDEADTDGENEDDLIDDIDLNNVKPEE